MEDKPDSCFSLPLTAAWGFKSATQAIDHEHLPYLPKEALASVKEICGSSFEIIIAFIEKHLEKYQVETVVEFQEVNKQAEPGASQASKAAP